MDRSEAVAYAAGYMDGEGHFSVRQNKVEVSAESVNPYPLIFLSEAFGGNVTRRDARNERSRATFRWRLYGDRARAFSEEILERLLVKRPEAYAVVHSKDYPEDSQTGQVLRERAVAWRQKEFAELPLWEDPHE